MKSYDFAIVGAGIAGASLAAELAKSGADVLLLEAEDAPGYHATGRSAAFWEECYGGRDIVPLTRASGPWLRSNGFLSQRGALYIGRQRDLPALENFHAEFASTGVALTRLNREELAGLVPGILPEWVGAIWEPGCADIDVAALHAAFLGQAKTCGTRLECRARVLQAVNAENGWNLTVDSGAEFRSRVLVNAAGAWADDIARLAGARPIGISPLRRTVLQLRTNPVPRSKLPLVLDIGGRFYFKPESGRLWLSPHDEEPSAPTDSAPEELAVAIAIERLQSVVDWQVAAVEKKWAGLRSFAPDRRPVYGYDPVRENFAWFAGQGGFGIQTSPAAARLGAQILLDLPRDAMTAGLSAADYSPARFL